MQKYLKFVVPSVIVVLGFALAGVLVYYNYFDGSKLKASVNILASMTPQEAGEKTVKYVNDNILKGQGTAVLTSATQEKNLFRIKFSIGSQQIDSYVTLDGGLFFPEGIDLNSTEGLAADDNTTVGSFSVSTDNICLENGKPLVYFFGAESCPHCRWEYPVLKGIVAKFNGYISFHDNKDKDADTDVFNKYSTGGIPTTVIGCKYYRVGSGEATGQAEEEKNLTAILCKVTNGQPSSVCDAVKDLTAQVAQ